MQIIRAGDCRVMPWKNGGGTTTEIAVHPPGAALDEFDWRISMAHVGTDGPFSCFPGIDRTLSVLRGSGIVLAFSDGETMRLERTSAPYVFAADRAVDGVLIDGPIDDLNVMTRRGRARHEVERLVGAGPFALKPAGDVLLLVARSDGWVVEGREARIELATGDSLILRAGERVTVSHPQNGAELFAVDLWGEQRA